MTIFRKTGSNFQKLGSNGFVWIDTNLTKIEVMIKVSLDNATVLDENGKVLDLFN